MRNRIGSWMRRWADHIDPPKAPEETPIEFVDGNWPPSGTAVNTGWVRVNGELVYSRPEPSPFDCRGWQCIDTDDGNEIRCPSCDCSLTGCGTVSTTRTAL